MLPKVNRLGSKNEFELVKKKGKLFQSKSFGAIVYNREDKTPSRFGFIVSKKVSRKAVDRNKAKRKLRNVISEQLENIDYGFDLLILAKKGALSQNFEGVKKEMNSILISANLITDSIKLVNST